MSIDKHKLEKGAALILDGLGVDRKKDRNFQNTPERYASALTEMFTPPETEWASFQEEYNDFILLRDHRLYSLCPHHLLPIKLFVSIAYIPNGHVLGLSKLARLVHECNQQPLLQEKFTKDILSFLASICPGVKGAACLVEGKHGCLEMRGVKSDAHFLTYKFAGRFETDAALQDRFLTLCKTPRL